MIVTDGNCFFESIQDLADKFELPLPRDKHLLCLLITDSMANHPDFLTWVQEHFQGELAAFEKFVDRLRIHGHFTDGFGFTTLTTAHLLGTVI